MTSLVSSSCKSSATARRLHSGSKTVHFASLSFFRLVSSFHNISPLSLARIPDALFFNYLMPFFYNQNIRIIIYDTILSKQLCKVKCLNISCTDNVGSK